jgi:hypothetical protein
MWRGVSGSTSNPRCEQLRVVIATYDGRNELQFPVSTRPMINQERFYFQYGHALLGVSFRKEKWFCLGHGLVVHCCSAGPMADLNNSTRSRRAAAMGNTVCSVSCYMHPRYDEIETVVHSLLELEETQSCAA